MPFFSSPRVGSCCFSVFHLTGLGVPADPNLAACGIHVMHPYYKSQVVWSSFHRPATLCILLHVWNVWRIGHLDLFDMFVTCLLVPLYGDHKMHVVSSLQVLVPPGLHAVCKRPLTGWTNMAGKPRDYNSPSVRPATWDDFLSTMIPCLHTLSSSLLQLHFWFALLSSRPTSWAATSPPELVIEFHTHGAKSILLCCCEHYKSWGMKQLLQ